MSCRSDHQRKRSAQNGSREHLFQHDDFPLYLAPHSPHHRIASDSQRAGAHLAQEVCALASLNFLAARFHTVRIFARQKFGAGNGEGA